MKTMRFVAPALMVCEPGARGQAEAGNHAGHATREWINLNGRKVTARYLGVQVSNVALGFQNGKSSLIPRSSLSPEDQAFLRDNPAAFHTPWQASVNGDYSGVEYPGYESTGAMKTQYVLHTIAHEVGHIMLGKGHPDDKGGPAPLLGTNHLERLMVSGGGDDRAKKINSRIVKGEWDAAEDWMKGLPYGQQTSPPP